ncbi:hypothetical protein FQN53_005552 [Emmonsiellopsis sp. PD_33]|nr:hypothetical protein FQN53_005552 [Emmonsiellopsis sp. PD_33]
MPRSIYRSPNTRERATSATTSTHPTTEPASLLWAHQLRREHTALVSNFDKLEESTLSSTERAEAVIAKLKDEVLGRLGKLEQALGIVQKDVREFGGWKEKVEDREDERDKDREFEEGEEKARREKEKELAEVERVRRDKERDDILGSIEGLKGVVDGLGRERGREDFIEDIKMLKGVVEEIKRERELEKQRERETEEERERMELERHISPITTLEPPSAQQPNRSSSPVHPADLQHSRQIQTRQKFPSHFPSTISGTPTMSHLPTSSVTRSSPPRDCSPLLVPDSHSLELDLDPSSLSSALVNTPPNMPKADLKYMVPDMRQGQSEHLTEYLSRGEDVLASFPRREESRIVQAFWDGLGDSWFKKAMEQKLDEEGWRWEVVKGVVANMHESVDGLSKDMPLPEQERDGGDRSLLAHDGAGEKKRKTKKRRMIPVIWPVDGEEEDWFVVPGACNN